MKYVVKYPEEIRAGNFGHTGQSSEVMPVFQWPSAMGDFSFVELFAS